jgi:apolipoprotein N-acyltransferase
MQKTFSPIFRKPWHLAVLAGVSVFLAFETYSLVPFIVFFPVFLNALILECKSIRQAFLYGFLSSFVIMLGAFYWVTYVIHEFGYLPWSISALLFLGFCGFGALNFPLFTALAYWFHQRLSLLKLKPAQWGLWFALALPSLFTLVEWFIPKLFPWSVGHSLYKQLWIIQICEITGESFLSFSIYSLGSVLGIFIFSRKEDPVCPRWLAVIPLSLLSICIAFSSLRLNQGFPMESKSLKVGLVQANIGNLDKVASRQGIVSKVDYVLDQYQKLTRQLLSQKPDLIVWPETAIPFQMDTPGSRQDLVRNFVREIGIPLISGGYATSPIHVTRDYNAAYLFDPAESDLRTEIYYKNILLAFGEYLPLGDTFPQLYKTFPQVSDFERGTDQRFFTLNSGTRLGVSICYEAIVPSFMRKVAGNQVHVLVNLTNDSWFGPTSEPYLHGALSVFRSIEHRLPLIRVTNTGSSFTVDRFGHMSPQTPVYEPATLISTIEYNPELSRTIYGRFGDWFILIAVGVFLSFFLKLRAYRASFPL